MTETATDPSLWLTIAAILLLLVCSAFFSGSLLIEKIFSLDGLGLLGWESVINRDYPVIFATMWIFSLLGVWLLIVACTLIFLSGGDE